MNLGLLRSHASAVSITLLPENVGKESATIDKSSNDDGPNQTRNEPQKQAGVRIVDLLQQGIKIVFHRDLNQMNLENEKLVVTYPDAFCNIVF